MVHPQLDNEDPALAKNVVITLSSTRLMGHEDAFYMSFGFAPTEVDESSVSGCDWHHDSLIISPSATAHDDLA